MKKPLFLIPTVFVLGIVGIALMSFSPVFAAVDFQKNHEMPEISGSLIASDSMQGNIEMEKIHFSVATAVAENAVTDGQTLKGHLGAVQGFLVYMFGVVDSENQLHKVIVDAGNGFTLYVSEGKPIDEMRNHGYDNKWSHNKMMNTHGTGDTTEMHGKMMYSHGEDNTTEMHGKMMGMHGKMKSHLADLTSEEREAKFAQFKEMKQAFSSISDEDRETIMTHFKEMKTQYADLSDEERTAKHAEKKDMMEEFVQLTLDEKIEKLTELANSLRSN